MLFYLVFRNETQVIAQVVSLSPSFGDINSIVNFSSVQFGSVVNFFVYFIHLAGSGIIGGSVVSVFVFI
jgi:hypothetical protein